MSTLDNGAQQRKPADDSLTPARSSTSAGPNATELREQGIAAASRIATDRDWKAPTQLAELTKGEASQAQFKYDRMFEDGVLDITVGVGMYYGQYNPTPGAHDTDDIVRAIERAGFLKVDFARVAALYAKTGRTMADSRVGKYYVRSDAVKHRDAEGMLQLIPAVIRLVNDPDGSHGKETGQAYEEGLASSDVAYFSGHCNYGTGPDFDGGASFRIRAQNGGWSDVPNYDVLYEVLEKEGAPEHMKPIEVLERRLSDGSLQIIPKTDGDLQFNGTNRSHYDDEHARFGATIAFFTRRPGKEGSGARRLTGEKGSLNTEAVARKYHVWVFDQCRSIEYLPGIRSTPSLGRDNTDVLATRREGLGGPEEQSSLLVFLNSIMSEANAQTTLQRIEDVRPSREEDDKTISGPSVIGSGFGRASPRG